MESLDLAERGNSGASGVHLQFRLSLPHVPWRRQLRWLRCPRSLTLERNVACASPLREHSALDDVTNKLIDSQRRQRGARRADGAPPPHPPTDLASEDVPRRTGSRRSSNSGEPPPYSAGIVVFLQQQELHQLPRSATTARDLAGERCTAQIHRSMDAGDASEPPRSSTERRRRRGCSPATKPTPATPPPPRRRRLGTPLTLHYLQPRDGDPPPSRRRSGRQRMRDPTARR